MAPKLHQILTASKPDLTSVGFHILNPDLLSIISSFPVIFRLFLNYQSDQWEKPLKKIPLEGEFTLRLALEGQALIICQLVHDSIIFSFSISDSIFEQLLNRD